MTAAWWPDPYPGSTDLFDHPLHPYTQGLMASIPRADASFETEALNEIHGVVPSLTDLPAGCHFAPRCPEAIELCLAKAPALETVSRALILNILLCHPNY